MHCQKSGLDVVTSATTRYQLWCGALLVLRKIFGKFIIIFLFIIATGQTFLKTPTFSNAKR